MIFYFSATGNCRYVAQQLDDDIRSIPQEMRRGDELSYADDAIGIVYPIYGHMMTHMVRALIRRAHSQRHRGAQALDRAGKRRGPRRARAVPQPRRQV